MASKLFKPKELITLTFGDMAENHVGMEQIGKMVDKGEGFQIEDLEYIKGRMEALGSNCELIKLVAEYDVPPAHVLVIRKGVDSLLSKVGDKTQIDVFKEQKSGGGSVGMDDVHKPLRSN